MNRQVLRRFLLTRPVEIGPRPFRNVSIQYVASFLVRTLAGSLWYRLLHRVVRGFTPILVRDVIVMQYAYFTRYTYAIV